MCYVTVCHHHAAPGLKYETRSCLEVHWGVSEVTLWLRFSEDARQYREQLFCQAATSTGFCYEGLKTLLKRDKESYVRSLAENVKGYINANDLLPAYQALKKLCSKSTSGE